MKNHQILVLLVNNEGRYSTWPTEKPIRKGWKNTGKSGPEAVCLHHIKALWADMRRLSVARKIEGSPGV